MFQENKQRWSALLLRSPPMQEVIAEFTQRVTLVLEREIANNRT